MSYPDQRFKRQPWLILLFAWFLLAGCQANTPASSPTTPSDEAMLFDTANVTAVSVVPAADDVMVATVVGEHPDGCTTISDVTVNFNDGTYFITLTSSRPADALCTQQIVPFSEAVILDVTDQPDDIYQVSANGIETVFIIASDTPTPAIAIMEVDPTEGSMGNMVTLTGTGLPADTAVEIGFGRVNSQYDIIDSAQTDASGTFSITLPVPSFAVEPGEWVFVTVTPDDQIVISNRFTVTE